MTSSEVPSYTTGTTTEAAPHPRRRLIFAIVSMGLFMAAVDQTIVASALPAIQHELAAPVNWSGWTITIYALGQVLMMPVAGRISDQFGRKKVFLVAAVVFTAASLACGFATDVYLLVVLRAIQAIGGGAFMPSATGIVADNFGPERDRALGMFTSIFPIGGIVGPIAGGVFTAFWSWRGIFLINVPIGLVLIVLALKYLPSSEPRDNSRVDFHGVALLGVLVLTSMLGITYLGSGGTSLLSPVFLACEAAAVVAVVFFVRHTKRHPAPFIPFELMRGRGFGVMNLINLCYGAAALGFGALVPLYAEDRYHIQSLEAGTLLTARAVGTICVAALAVLALRRTGHRLPMLVGFLILAAGLVAMYAAPPGISPYLWLTISSGVSGIGMGLTVPATNNASLQLAPDKVAAIAGLRGMFRQSGAIISISVTTAVIARSSDAGLAQAYILLAFAVLMVAVLPLLLLVPDHRGSW
ncbi:MFS transporter [Amycolatopsis acidiphila]|uniref:MFS transporter n=1 Tax=Amycolatopsis acidiphila TaxID=715473 RepID=A0A558ACE2_9PSEU|nr:MFS transporter [Amycolatopsis acidiphila]TVT21941.1 MFS transporter [Amycolatopsis acidiphila]UIJ57365.1 MFS transporter [Amycolatopsis acidiphila]